MTKVLVWQGYGCTDVYNLDFKNLYEMVLSVVEFGYPEEVIQELKLVETVGQLASWVNENCEGDDSFDKFEIVEVK